MSRWKFFGLKSVGAIRVGDFANLLDGEVIVIGDKTYEWDNNAAVTAGHVLVTIGASDAACIVNLMAAINANKPSIPVSAVVDPKDAKTARIYADNRGAAGNIDFTTDMADAGNVIAAVDDLLANGENGGNQIRHRGVYVVTAIDILADNLMIETGLPNSIDWFSAEVRTTAGVPKAHTMELTASGTKIRGNFAGATDPVEGDVITWEAGE